jgi:large subunit ribosomal protein L6
MSRIGKKPVEIPNGVSVNIDGLNVEVKGTKGILYHTLPNEVSIEIVDNLVQVKPKNKSDKARSMWGLSRTLVKNMIEGVSTGFVQYLDVNGVGYKSTADSTMITLSLGLSHDIKYIIPEGIVIKTPIHGFDKQLVGQVAAELRALRKPEPYKGKGIKYRGEKVRRKEGKKK